MKNTIQTFFLYTAPTHNYSQAALSCKGPAIKDDPLWPRKNNPRWTKVNFQESRICILRSTLQTNVIYCLSWCLVLLPSLCLWERWPAGGPFRRKASRKQHRLDLISSQSIRRLLRHFSLNRSVGLSNISMCGAKQAAWVNPLRPHWHDVFTGNSDEFKDSFRSAAETTAPMLPSDQTFQSSDQKTSADGENRQSPRTGQGRSLSGDLLTRGSKSSCMTNTWKLPEAFLFVSSVRKSPTQLYFCQTETITTL